MNIKYKKLVPEAQTPYRKYDVDAGFDLYAVSKEETKDYIEYKTGIAFEIPSGYVGLIFPRSSITNYDLILKNSVGVIDASFRGEIRFRFQPVVNDNIKEIMVDVEKECLRFIWNVDKQYNVGDRIGQIVIIKIPEINLVEVQELSDTDRGTGGFGSTNKKIFGVIASSKNDFLKQFTEQNTKFINGNSRHVTTPNGDEYICISKLSHVIGFTLDDIIVTEDGYENPEFNKIAQTILPIFTKLSEEKLEEIKKKLRL